MDKLRREELLLLVVKLSVEKLRRKELSEKKMNELTAALEELDLSLENALKEAEKILLRKM